MINPDRGPRPPSLTPPGDDCVVLGAPKCRRLCEGDEVSVYGTIARMAGIPDDMCQTGSL